MIPISPEREGSRARFTVVAIATVVALVVAASVLAGIAVVRGPQVRGVTGDPSEAVAQRDLSLTLRADQPLDPSSADGIRIEPFAPAQVEVSGASVRVRFTGTLAFATDYRLVVPALRSLTTGAVSAADFSFSTPALTMTTLERAGAFDRHVADDRVVRHDLSHGVDTTVLTAPRIQEYADEGDGVIAVAVDQTGTPTLLRANADAATQTVPLPGPGTVRLLRSSASAHRTGFVYTGLAADGTEYRSTLFLLDPGVPDARARAVTGLDGAPVSVDAWQFVPATSFLVAQTPDRRLLLIDATGAAPARALGELGDLRSFLPATAVLVAGTAVGLSVLDLTDGSVREVPGTATRESGTGVLVAAPDAVVSWTPTEVTRTVAGASTVLLRAIPGERVQEVCVSPEGRLLAVGSVPDDAPLDGYPARADWQGRITRIVDAETGTPQSEVAGTRPSWCS